MYSQKSALQPFRIVNEMTIVNFISWMIDTQNARPLANILKSHLYTRISCGIYNIEMTFANLYLGENKYSVAVLF